MRSLHAVLEEAEGRWRDDLEQDYNSVWHDIPLDTTRENYDERPWQFYTDLDTIYAEIHEDEALQDQFEDVVTDYWEGESEELAVDTVHSILFHELYHPLEAPSSRTDERRIHQAIRRGLLRAEPDMGPQEQVTKVRASQNAVKDFILDNRFYLDNQDGDYVREDIIPVWDVMELDRHDGSHTDMYTITRHVYGTLYGPETTHSFFAVKAGEEGVAVAEEALEAVLEHPVDLPTDRLDGTNLDASETAAALERYTRELRDRFQNRQTRYTAVEDMMAVLGPYVTEQMPGAPEDLSGVSSEGDVLQDLLDDMDDEEAEDFMDDLRDDLGEGDDGDGSAGGHGGGSDTETDIDRLALGAVHEYYRNNHPTVTLRGDGVTGERVDAGTRKYLEVSKEQLVPEERLAEVDLQAVARAHKRGIPMLLPADDDMYRLLEYDEREEVVHDVSHADRSLQVPDVIEFYLDSSGSMFHRSSGFEAGDDSRFDMANHVLYGMVDAFQQVEAETGARISLRVHNFASSQVSSPEVGVDTFWSGDDEVLRTLYRANNGSDTKALSVQRYADDRQHAHVVVSDGDMDNAASQVSAMQDRQQEGDHPVMIEIGGTYNLGEAIDSVGIPYRQVHDKEEMLDEGLSLLLSP